MTIPIYITASILAVLFAYISDRVGKRSPFIVGFLCIMVVGFTMYVTLSTGGGRDSLLTGNQEHHFFQPACRLRRRVHRYLLHLSRLPRCHYLAVQQLGR